MATSARNTTRTPLHSNTRSTTIMANSMDDDEQSVLSILTSSVIARLGGAGSDTTTPSSSNQENEDALLLEQKQDDICRCLQGASSDDEQVDLWQLRQFALTRGGLVSSQCRKRAWPKLVGAHDLIWLSQTTTPGSADQQHQHQLQVPVSNASMVLLKKDIALTVWNVEDHVHMARQREATRNTAAVKKVSFQELPDLKEAQSEESTDTLLSPTKSVSVPNHATDEDDDDDYDMGSVGTFSPATTLGTMETFASAAPIPRRPASKNEQKVLFNIIVSVLRLAPTDSPHFEDDRYKYYKGLTDMAALLLIHLESPSLTSLLLGKLATHHLRDAMRSAGNNAGTMSATTTTTNLLLQSAIERTLGPLLQSIDEELYTLLFGSSDNAAITTASCLVPWIRGWFCQQLTDVNMASRLMDVFLVSHATMPIYFSAAFLSHPLNRTKLMAAATTNDSGKAIYHALRMAPLLFMKEQHVSCGVLNVHEEEGRLTIASVVVEDMIQMALSLIDQHPPEQLLLSGNDVDKTASTSNIAMLQPLPAWATTDVAPTDYAMLQRAKAMRAGTIKQSGSTTTKQSAQTLQLRYPQALAATGGIIKTGTNKSRFVIMVMVLLLIVVATATALGGAFWSQEKVAFPITTSPLVPAAVSATKQKVQQQPKKKCEPVVTSTTKKTTTSFATSTQPELKRPAPQVRRNTHFVPATPPKKIVAPALESASSSKQTAHVNMPTSMSTTKVSTTTQQPTFMAVMAATQKAIAPPAAKNKLVMNQTPSLLSAASILMAPSVVPLVVDDMQPTVVSTPVPVRVLGKILRKLVNRLKALFARFIRQK